MKTKADLASKTITKLIRQLIVFAAILTVLSPVPVQAALIPQTGLSTIAPVQSSVYLDTKTSTQPALDLFIENLINGNKNQVVGVYQENLFAQKVVQQPASDAAYVAPFKNQITQFDMVKQMTGNLGLMAHNYLSGELFFDLKVGDEVQVIFGDGQVQNFKVDQILSFQALTPDSVYSDFVNLDDGSKLSASQLFEKAYGGTYHLTFQTCIRNGDESSWGRLFVIATPIDDQI